MITTLHPHGTRDLSGVADGPVVSYQEAPAITLQNANVLHLLLEVPASGVEEVLPPPLYRSNPAAISFLVIRAHDGPFGAFVLAQGRVVCRAGLKPRAFTTASFVDSPVAAEALNLSWGFDAQLADVTLHHGYHAVTSQVSGPTGPILDLALGKPTSFQGEAFLAPSMNLVNSVHGARVIEVDYEPTIHRVDRGVSHIDRHDDTRTGLHGLGRARHVSAFSAVADLVLGPPGWVCDPLTGQIDRAPRAS